MPEREYKYEFAFEGRDDWCGVETIAGASIGDVIEEVLWGDSCEFEDASRTICIREKSSPEIVSRYSVELKTVQSVHWKPASG